MSDIDTTQIPLIRFPDGTELYMTVQHVQRGENACWHMTAILGYVQPTRTAQAVELVWRGHVMDAVLLSITPHVGADLLAAITFLPDPALGLQ